MTDISPPLRRADWFGKTDKNGSIHRSWLKNQGHPHHMFDGRTVVFENIEDDNARIDDPDLDVDETCALVRDGDMIDVDVDARRLHLDVPDDELARRRNAWQRPTPIAARGYVSLYINHVGGADQGADLDFLVGASGSRVTRDSH